MKKNLLQNVLRHKCLVLILFIQFITTVDKSYSQNNRYTILIPTKQYNNISTSNPDFDIQHLMDEVVKYANIYKHNVCMEKLEPIIQSNVKKEMSKIREGTPYVLVVDYVSCKFISLKPDKGGGDIIDKNSTIYYITLYQEIKREAILKDDLFLNAAGVITQQHPDGKWTARSPYLGSDTFDTEIQALESLYYEKKDLIFVTKVNGFNIYKSNEKLKGNAKNMRELLEESKILLKN